MKREQIQEKFRQLVERTRNGKADERRAAEPQIKEMAEEYPWLRDYARWLGLTEFPGLVTREYPWLAPPARAAAAKTLPTDIPGRTRRAAVVSKDRPKTVPSCATGAWVKPPTAPGFEYRQCYKPNCKCMNGGAWHGPYHYRKQRQGSVVRSEYGGRKIVSETNK